MLTREEALRKHREMWTAMQMEFGDNPAPVERIRFKKRWCKTHGDADVRACCYLCQFVKEHGISCYDCPIDWKTASGCGDANKVNWLTSPISEILALPEREAPNEDQSWP